MSGAVTVSEEATRAGEWVVSRLITCAADAEAVIRAITKSIDPELKRLDDALDDNRRKAHEAWKSAVALRESVPATLKAKKAQALQAVEAWRKEQRQRVLAAHEAMKVERRERLLEAASEELVAGEVETAMELATAAEDETALVPPKATVKVRGLVERTTGRLEVVDVFKLHGEYTMLVADKGALRQAEKDYGEGAVLVVGEPGAVRWVETVTTFTRG